MDISLKYKIVEKIITSNDEALLNEIQSLIGLSESDFWSDIPLEVKKAIHQSQLEHDHGKGIPNHQVMEEMKNRFLNR
ncbi:hypothetical protein [Pedobacter glucosidilyticus]|uniref:hypothetical protein n=1 Tax=Pedobacter glucosidilyticus TaxID=1122941 RepID=UPI0026F2563C|nr:hypothetical protein [Pedobacter glucosidilyticus]